MSNILTDVLGFFKRRKFVKENKPDDVLILGINESPDMLGIASPVPYKDVKLIKVKDLKVTAKECQRINLGNTGEPIPFPPPANIAGVFKNVTTDVQTGDCFANFRSLKSVSLNLSITQNLNDIEFDTLGEPNTAANVGTGVELYQSKVGETLNFRTLVSGDSSVTFSQGTDEIDIRVNAAGEINTASNVGAGQGIFKQKTGTDLEFYSLTSSDNSIDIDLITQDNVIDLTSTNQGTVTGTGTTNTLPLWTDGPNGVLGDSFITQDPVNNTVDIRNNVEISDETLTVGYKGTSFLSPNNAIVIRPSILQAPTQGSATLLFKGNAQNVNNVDAASIFTNYDNNTGGQILRFKAVAPTNNLTQVMSLFGVDGKVRLDAYGGGTHTGTAAYSLSIDTSGNVIETTLITPGEVNTASNVGTGAGQVFKQKVNEDLEFRTIKAGSNVTVTNNTDDIEIASQNTTNDSLTLNGTTLDLLDSDGNTVSANLSSLDTDTTYNLGSSQNGNDVDVTLDASTGTADNVKLVAGTNVTLTDNGSNQVTIDAAGGGESNTASNVGSGSGEVFKQKTGVDLELKTIKAGTNTTVTNNTDDITIESVDTTYNLGAVGAAGNINVALTGSGGTNDVVSVQAGTNITLTDNGSNTFTIDAAGGSGEVNTASNLGAGEGVFAQKVNADLEFKSLVAGTNITLTSTGNDITIDAAGGASGEANTASNVGTGAGVFKQKVGVDLELRKINAGSNVTVTENTDEITIAATDTDTTYDIKSAQNVNDVDLILNDSAGTTSKVKLIAGTNITLTDSGSSEVRIDSAGGAATCATTTSIGGMVVGRVTSDKPVVVSGTALAVEVNDQCEGYVTVPDPPVRASFQAIWTGAVNPYFNFQNGTQTVFPYDGFPLNFASIGAGQCVSTINVAPTGTTFDVVYGGFYKVSVNAHFFNLINGVNIEVEYSNNTSGAIQGLINQEGIYGNDEDVNFFGEYIVEIASGDNIGISILFNGGGTNPFPANARNLFCSMTLEKID